MKLALLAFVVFSSCAYSQNLNPSVYYITQSAEDSDNCSVMRKLLDEKGNVLAQVCKDFYKKCILEATCMITENDQSKILNYTQMINDIPRFAKVDTERCPYGLGVNQICLDPFYSVAADLKYHKPGEVLYIDKLKGLKLPNEGVHSGYVIVRDSGGAIKGPNRFDFFTGTLHFKDPENSISQVGFSSTLNSYPYKIITGSKADEVRKLRNYPLVPKAEK